MPTAVSSCENTADPGEKSPSLPMVAIVDRDSMSSDLLAQALKSGGRFQARGMQPEELLESLHSEQIQLAVISADLNDKAGDGFRLAERVASRDPLLPIAMLLGYSSQESVVQAFRAGARGVFSRQQPVAEFIHCVDHVGRGLLWAGREETSMLLRAFKSIPAPGLLAAVDGPALTSRELEVVQEAAKGKTNKAIAAEMGLSEHTIKNYLFRAFEKLGVSSRVELLFYLTMRGHTFGVSTAPALDDNETLDLMKD